MANSLEKYLTCESASVRKIVGLILNNPEYLSIDLKVHSICKTEFGLNFLENSNHYLISVSFPSVERYKLIKKDSEEELTFTDVREALDYLVKYESSTF